MLPLTVGPRNCEAATGVPWRWLRDHAAELGVQIVRIDGKSVIVATELLAALERYAGRIGTAFDDQPEATRDELAAMRTRIARAG